MKLSVIFLNFCMIHTAISIQKCCDGDSYLEKSENRFNCVYDNEKRLQIFTKNYLNNSTEDQCLDINNGEVNEYKIINNTLTDEKPFQVNLFPKCCPLGYIYNSVIHSCMKTTKIIDEKFIRQYFINVGLPACKVIEDYPLDANEDFLMEINFLHLVKFNKKIDYGKYCIDRDENMNLIARVCYDDLKICGDTRCIHKCCPDGQSFVRGRNCNNTYVNGINLEFSSRINNTEAPFAIIHDYSCRLYIMYETRYQYYLDQNGLFWVFYNKTNSYQSFDVAENFYCIEHVSKSGSLNGFYFFGCIMDHPIPIRSYITRWTNIISCIFVVLTLLVYFMLPELLNLFGKILVCYCIAMLSLFVVSTYMQFERGQSDHMCLILSYVILFASLCGFSWLNVMCFDIWYTFGRPRNHLAMHQKRKENQKFLFYCLYAWNLPTLLILVIYVISRMDHVPYSLKPFIGKYKCYFEKRNGNYAMLIYYVIPLFIMNMINLFLFVKTIIYCLRVKGEIHRMNDNRMSIKEQRKNFVANKEQLTLIIKLGITMGITFIFEAFSAFFDFNSYSVMSYVELTWDTFNSLQGLFIFIIFVCKKRIVNLCRTKMCGQRIRKSSISCTMITEKISIPVQSKSKVGRV